ncbi:hypothetical protein N7468_002728 [Penicillium chermesinum]|uniref:Yeast cell wall synthesis Kre9/Knh1-like N-terminal domain-containing protein n=1 Tax=Penicillium chermesinum TaxID=63820 RepID=A0A9W9PJ46_9EURO|nr:uncharacterized protein N7468_002728 [Penicillium chermesinum]KAJ5247745.1 hypothetical protein N7468_002728 [Penicillium chermesinum]KAJ6151510.1 hypothetical protein N7470_007107 [Penicillium chermesinum]
MYIPGALLVLPLAAVVGALSVTNPEQGAILDPKSSLVVKWTSVEYVPSPILRALTFTWSTMPFTPPVSKKLASDVDTDKGSYNVGDLGDIKNGHGYQINLLSDSTQNTGILAQSQQFNVSDSAASSSSSTTATSSTSSSSSSSSSSTSVTSTTESSSTTWTTSTTMTTKGAESTSATTGTATASSSSGHMSSSSVSASATPMGTVSPNAGDKLNGKHHAAVLGVAVGAMALFL